MFFALVAMNMALASMEIDVKDQILALQEVRRSPFSDFSFCSQIFYKIENRFLQATDGMTPDIVRQMLKLITVFVHNMPLQKNKPPMPNAKAPKASAKNLEYLLALHLSDPAGVAMHSARHPMKPLPPTPI